MNPRIIAIAAAVVVVLFTLKNTDGYYPWPTQVVPSEQANDDYLESLLKAAGYEGKYVAPSNVNPENITLGIEFAQFLEIPIARFFHLNFCNQAFGNR